jgi:hypothetical protein
MEKARWNFGALLIVLGLILVTGCAGTNKEVVTESKPKEPLLTDADREYIHELNDIVIELEHSLMEVYPYAVNAGNPGSRYYQPSDLVLRIKDNMIHHYETLRKLEPPKNFEKYHKDYMASVSYLKKATNYLESDYRDQYADTIFENFNDSMKKTVETGEAFDAEFPDMMEHYKAK